MKNRLLNWKVKQMFLRKIFVLILLIGLIATVFVTMSYGEEGKSKYILGAGDVIEISVWNQPELKREMSIRPDGWISFPLVGEVQASGNNPAVLAEQIRQKLLQYLKDPKVSVIVTKYGSKKILVLGEIKKPGLYQYEGGMTVFDAIGVAEGYNKHAELKSILVVRDAYSKRPEFYLANLYKAIHDGNLSEDVILASGDIVYVPQNFIGNLGDFMDYFMSRIRPAADTYLISQVATSK